MNSVNESGKELAQHMERAREWPCIHVHDIVSKENTKLKYEDLLHEHRLYEDLLHEMQKHKNR